MVRALGPLNHVTILWSAIAAAALLLGVMHLMRGFMDRRSRTDFAFAASAFCLVGVAYTELQSMSARTPEEWVFWIRWCYVPVSGLVVALALTVKLYLGTGRTWLVVSLVGVRIVILLLNFLHDPTIAFDRVDSITSVPFLGERISVVDRAETSSWQWLGTAANFLLIYILLDATIAHWRKGGREGRRRALVMGGAVALYALVAGLYVQFVLWRLTTLPLLITPTFAILMLAMAYELSREALHASRLAAELQDSKRRLEMAAGAASIGLWEWDSRTGRVWSTRQSREIFGFADAAPPTFDGWLERIHAEDRAWVRESARPENLRDDSQVAEFRVCPPGSAMRWVTAGGRVGRTDGGRHLLMRGFMRDTTDQRRTQEETRALRSEVAHAGRVSLLGQLASSLAHELSQPLGAILRNSEAAEFVLAAAQPDCEELKEINADIHRDGRRAGDVIDRLRALLKHREMQMQPVAIDGLMQDVVTLVRADSVSRHVQIDCVTDPGLPSVPGDRVHLSQVLLNVIMNGMDSVMSLEPAHRRLSVRARRDGRDRVAVEITDSGPGIPEAQIGHVFDPFFTTKAAGMGLGLSISRTIAEAHGGTLEAENGMAGGAVFRLILPVAAGGAP